MSSLRRNIARCLLRSRRRSFSQQRLVLRDAGGLSAVNSSPLVYARIAACATVVASSFRQADARVRRTLRASQPCLTAIRLTDSPSTACK